MKKLKTSSANIQLLLLHLVFWILLVLPPFLFRYNAPESRFSDYSLYRFLISNILLALIFYLNAFYLYPHIFKKKGISLYIISIIVMIILSWFFSQYVDIHVFPSKHKWGRPFFSSIISYIFILGTSCSYRIVMDHIHLQKVNEEKETENLKTELSFLRSQVSPHFMFNVLNNLVSLARKKSDKMEPALLQLSSLLRYMLYEGNHGKINLSQEINYLQGYIDLQKLRFGDDVQINFEIIGNPDGFKLEPMLLIPYVENAFKHGMGSFLNPKIDIKLQIKDNTLWFEVENDIQPVGESKDSSSGIGLINTQRRLDLLYKNHYTLVITKVSERYLVKLKLQMND